MLNRVRGYFKGALLAAGVVTLLGVTAGAASADVFTVDPSALGGPAVDRDAYELGGNYKEVLTITSFDAMTGSGTFETVAYWSIGGLYDQANNLVAFTGVGTNYGLYAMFSADGSFTCTAPNNCLFTATPNAGEVELWADLYTGFVTTGLALPGTGTGGIASVAALRTNAADDVLLASATLASGDGDSSPGAAAGNFDLTFGTFTLTDVGGNADGNGYFVKPRPFYLVVNLEGNFDEFFINSLNQSIVIEGSANAAFVPEPASILLMGMGLLGVGVAARRRVKA